MGFAKFVSGTLGRGVRVAAGFGLIARGVSGGGPVLALVGLVPLAAGLLDLCLLAPLVGAPLRGRDVRARP